METIVLAGGCFWGVENVLSRLPDVQTIAGYANGKTDCPSYSQVCSGTTGFAEAVEIKYHPSSLSLPQILLVFFQIIDPYALNRQGNDIGEQYRTGIYYTDEIQKKTAEVMLAWLQNRMHGVCQVELCALKNFYPAEEYHQKYLIKNPGGYCHLSADQQNPVLYPLAEIEQAIPALKGIV